MFQRLYPALGAAYTLRLRSVSIPGLARFLDVRSLGNVRRRIQVTMMRDTTGVAVWLRVVAHVQVRLTDMALPGRVRCIRF